MVKFCRTLLLLLLLLLPMKRTMVSGLLLLKKQKWWCRWRTERRRDGFEDFYASVGRRRTKREETLPKPLRDDEVNDDVGRDERLRRLNHLPLLPWSSRRTAAMTTRATTRATTARTTKCTTTKIVANLRISPRLLKNIKHFSNRRTCEFRVGSFNDHLRIYCSTCCVHDKYPEQIPQSNYYLSILWLSLLFLLFLLLFSKIRVTRLIRIFQTKLRQRLIVRSPPRFRFHLHL